jgi:nitrite reductase/ring-hydroxylating ferredoxin subunit
MAMASGESVSGTLIHRSALPDSGLVALDVVICGEIESIVLDCGRNPLLAWRNACPHQGRRLDYAPGHFLIDRGQLVCAAHGAVFRLDDGQCTGGPCRGEHLARVQVEQDADGTLRFALPADGAAARTSG